MSKKSSDPLTRVSEKRPVALAVQPLVVTGPVRLFVVDELELPPELLERLIVLTDDAEDSPCR